jgi:DNA mismatch repair protein MutL
LHKIHELPSILADQIAAGEVVERPASVVKELVENAIDAQSTQIDINVYDAGLKSIEIIDDGIGINHDDVQLAFKRHATSKINSPHDLFKVKSLGFRGEALPSIASVSDVTLKTSTGDEGTLLHIKGGKLIDIMPSSARKGTSVLVKDLFYNTPARLKYMKTIKTELSQISDIVDRLALGHPEIAFSLVHNQHEIIRTSGRSNLQQVIGDIYGAKHLREIIKIDNHDDDFNISGYVSLPELTRASRNYVTLILNGRYVKSTALFKALIDGYGSKLMVGRYPIAVLNIQLDPTLIDVNVHPTKQTVRISKEEALCNLISHTIYQSIFKENLIPKVMTRDRSVQPRYTAEQLQFEVNQASEESKTSTLNATPAINEKPKNRIVNSKIQTNQSLTTNISNIKPIMITNVAQLDLPMVRTFATKYKQPVGPFDDLMKSIDFTSDNNEYFRNEQHVTSVTRFPNLIYLGQLHGTYLLAESDDGLYLIDQHAAQERINYERLRVSIGDVAKDQQRLLVPIVLDYPNRDALIIEQRMDTLRSIGIKIETFGKNSFVIHQHPTWIQSGQEESTIREIIDWIINDNKLTVAKFREKTAIMMSCKQAIKANHHLDRKQAVSLIKQLSTVNNPFNCPHGRPVLVSFTNQDLQKMFKRIQDPHTNNRI